MAGPCPGAGPFKFLRVTGRLSRLLVTVVGPMDAVRSQIEVAFIQQGATYYSASSSTLNN